jgi:hypothetical protein
MLGTAAHCVYQSDRRFDTNYPVSIDVYCPSSGVGGGDACAAYDSGTPTTRGTRALVTATATRRAQMPGTWDAAVISLADDVTAATGATPVELDQATSRTRPFAARLAGFPMQNGESAACSVEQYKNACRQYGSQGMLDPSGLRGGGRYGLVYTSSSLDMCRGHSGSPVFEESTGRVVAVVSGSDNARCVNVYAPLLNASNADARTCERAGSGGAGVSLACLSQALARRAAVRG